MAQQIKITQTSNADMNIGVPKNMTAVEWLAEQMLHPESFNPYIEQAKAMEKEQIVDAYDNGMHDVDNKYYNIIQNGGETYYNQTYNK